MRKNGKHFWDQGRLSQKSVFFGVQWFTTSLVEEHKKTTWGKSRIKGNLSFREQLVLLMGSKGKSKTIKGKHVPPSSGRDSTSVAVLL